MAETGSAKRKRETQENSPSDERGVEPNRKLTVYDDCYYTFDGCCDMRYGLNATAEDDNQQETTDYGRCTYKDSTIRVEARREALNRESNPPEHRCGPKDCFHNINLYGRGFETVNSLPSTGWNMCFAATVARSDVGPREPGASGKRRGARKGAVGIGHRETSSNRDKKRHADERIVWTNEVRVRDVGHSGVLEMELLPITQS
ncbi:hypothetical protein AAG570_005764 [Ranatra chinensis]|uniref:Uncharacterized protein n=1 Tax=Ranatra chinensis TaxID=642074 RepID=A0ABD0YGR5_9HEMI